jgi:FG-GAP-like repeat
MKLIHLACCLLILAGVPLLAQNVRQPLIPASAKPGSKGFTLTVNGTGFFSGAVVKWNGSPRLTERISGRQLKATIKASDVAKAGTAWVTVANGGGVDSNAVFFPIRQPSSVMTFAQRLVFPGCTAVAVGDFNNDGLLDVAWSGPDGVLNVSLGNGKGGFQAPISSGDYGGPTLIPGDFNRDGNLDLAIVRANSVQILLGDGHGNLTYKSQVSAIGGTILSRSLISTMTAFSTSISRDG